MSSSERQVGKFGYVECGHISIEEMRKCPKCNKFKALDENTGGAVADSKALTNSQRFPDDLLQAELARRDREIASRKHREIAVHNANEIRRDALIMLEKILIERAYREIAKTINNAALKAEREDLR